VREPDSLDAVSLRNSKPGATSAGTGLVRVLLLLVADTFVGACTSAPIASTSSTASVPESASVAILHPSDDFCPGVTNFAKVSESLWRGAQPTAEGFRNLEKAGVKTVVNLRSDHDDADLLSGTNLKQVRIGTKAWDPDEDEIVAFLKVVRDRENWPVFVHCAKGQDRTGYCVASYRIVEQGWTPDDAIREMYEFRFNPIWMRNKSFLRKLDVAGIKARLADSLQGSRPIQ
jgi:tyrosine-protein phosphatase SIW14